MGDNNATILHYYNDENVRLFLNEIIKWNETLSFILHVLKGTLHPSALSFVSLEAKSYC